MGQFYDTDRGVGWASREELDRCALDRAGQWGGIGYSYACRGELPSRVHGYRPVWVNTQGMGNHGSIVLLPGDARTAELLRIGRVNALLRQFPGLSYARASRIDDARRGVKYAMEAEVTALVAHAVLGGYVAVLATCPPVGQGVNRWAERNAPMLVGHAMTAPRMDAAAEVARKLT